MNTLHASLSSSSSYRSILSSMDGTRVQPWHSSVPCSDVLPSEDETTSDFKCLPCFQSVNNYCHQLTSSTSVATDLSEFRLTSSHQNIHLHTNTRQYLREISLMYSTNYMHCFYSTLTMSSSQ